MVLGSSRRTRATGRTAFRIPGLSWDTNNESQCDERVVLNVRKYFEKEKWGKGRRKKGGKGEGGKGRREKGEMRKEKGRREKGRREKGEGKTGNGGQLRPNYQ
jgi:hypothetical protein